MRFEGLEPWPERHGQIECVVEGVWLDLHNAASFLGLRWVPPDALELSFDYDPARYEAVTRPDERRRALRLTFEGVRELRIGQPADFAPEAATEVHEWTYEGGRVSWLVGDLTVELRAEALRLDSDPPVMPPPSGTPAVDAVLTALRRGDWDALKQALHPDVHWTPASGETIRGRRKTLVHLRGAAPVAAPLAHELRDGRVHRWTEAGGG